jgi:hypothetical protein
MSHPRCPSPLRNRLWSFLLIPLALLLSWLPGAASLTAAELTSDFKPAVGMTEGTGDVPPHRLPLAGVAVLPAGRIDYVMAYFPPMGALIMHGGWHPSTDEATNWKPLSEVWKLDAGGWSQLSTTGAPAMTHHSMTYDAARQVLVLCGKKDFANWSDNTFATWEFDGTTWTRKADIPLGIGSGDVEIAYDPVRQVTVLYGAAYSGGNPETWEYNGGENAWTKKTPAQQPTATGDGALMKYDGSLGKVVLLAGTMNYASQTETDETWLWDGTAWTQAAGTQPSKGLLGGMAFDSFRNQMVLISTVMETWTFDGASWTKMNPAASPTPSPNGYFALAYHPAWHTSLFFGGESQGESWTYPETTWQWNGTTWALWAPPSVPGDINGDTSVTIADAILALQVLSATVPAGTAVSAAADANGDGRIGLAEAVWILQVTAGLRTAP